LKKGGRRTLKSALLWSFEKSKRKGGGKEGAGKKNKSSRTGESLRDLGDQTPQKEGGPTIRVAEPQKKICSKNSRRGHVIYYSRS